MSRNGQKLAAAYGGEKLRAITVPSRELLIPSDPMAKGVDYAWGTFSPDASRLFYASKGKLTMLNADDCTKLFDVALPDLALATFTRPMKWTPLKSKL